MTSWLSSVLKRRMPDRGNFFPRGVLFYFWPFGCWRWRLFAAVVTVPSHHLIVFRERLRTLDCWSWPASSTVARSTSHNHPHTHTRTRTHTLRSAEARNNNTGSYPTPASPACTLYTERQKEKLLGIASGNDLATALLWNADRRMMDGRTACNDLGDGGTGGCLFLGQLEKRNK